MLKVATTTFKLFELSAFKVAGGMVFVWMGFILFAASPGTITGVITLSVLHAKDGITETALVVICAAMIVTWPVMVLAGRAGGNQKPSLFRDVTSRFSGGSCWSWVCSSHSAACPISSNVKGIGINNFRVWLTIG